MKIKLFAIVSVLIIIALPLTGDDEEKLKILECMEFPDPALEFGIKLNDPLFCLSMQNKKISKSEIQESISSIEKNLSDKSDPELLYKLGNLYKDLEKFKESAEYYRKYIEAEKKVLKEENGSSKAFFVKGDIYLSLAGMSDRKNKTANLEKSLFYLSKAAELNPENSDALIKLGDCFLLLGMTTEALYCYNKVLGNSDKDFSLYTRLQAASFQEDFIKLSESLQGERIESQSVTSDFHFDYLETAINNSSADQKDSLKLQQYIYLMRLLLIKKENNISYSRNSGSNVNKYFTEDEEKIIKESENLIKRINSGDIRPLYITYISGMINYLKSDNKKALSDLKAISGSNVYPELIHDEILIITLRFLKDDSELKKITLELIKTNPDPRYYLILAGIEFRNQNMQKAEMLCNHSLKVDSSYPEAYSGIAVTNAVMENYITADAMIKKGNFLLGRSDQANKIFLNRMKTNEAAIALLKNEKERAYILLRSVITADNNYKAYQLYNRYFNKK